MYKDVIEKRKLNQGREFDFGSRIEKQRQANNSYISQETFRLMFGLR